MTFKLWTCNISIVQRMTNESKLVIFFFKLWLNLNHAIKKFSFHQHVSRFFVIKLNFIAAKTINRLSRSGFLDRFRPCFGLPITKRWEPFHAIYSITKIRTSWRTRRWCWGRRRSRTRRCSRNWTMLSSPSPRTTKSDNDCGIF
jgi:hypothetical protein